jgi:SPW repeat
MPGDVMLGGEWTRKTVLDLCKLACAAVLFCSPWVFGFSSIPAWNLWLCGYAMLTISVADLTAEADWEPHTSLYLGAWLVAAPWLLSFFEDSAATLLHVGGGGVIALLSAAELWSAERNPPWRFRPGAARRADLESLSDDMSGPQEIPARHVFLSSSRAPARPDRRRTSSGRRHRGDRTGIDRAARRAIALRSRPYDTGFPNSRAAATGLQRGRVWV